MGRYTSACQTGSRNAPCTTKSLSYRSSLHLQRSAAGCTCHVLVDQVIPLGALRMPKRQRSGGFVPSRKEFFRRLPSHYGPRTGEGDEVKEEWRRMRVSPHAGDTCDTRWTLPRDPPQLVPHKCPQRTKRTPVQERLPRLVAIATPTAPLLLVSRSGP